MEVADGQPDPGGVRGLCGSPIARANDLEVGGREVGARAHQRQAGLVAQGVDEAVPKFNAAGWRPLPYRRQALRARSARSAVTSTISISASRKNLLTTSAPTGPRRASTTTPSSTRLADDISRAPASSMMAINSSLPGSRRRMATAADVSITTGPPGRSITPGGRARRNRRSRRESSRRPRATSPPRTGSGEVGRSSQRRVVPDTEPTAPAAQSRPPA